MGACTYSNRIKHLLIDVPDDMLAEYGAVSEQVAKAMAEGVCKTAGSTYGIGITGIAGPGGGTAEKPVGLVYIGLTDGTKTWVKKIRRNKNSRTKQRLLSYTFCIYCFKYAAALSAGIGPGRIIAFDAVN